MAGAIVLVGVWVGGVIAFKLLRAVFLICEAIPLVRYGERWRWPARHGSRHRQAVEGPP